MLTDQKIDEIARRIGEHKGWVEQSWSDPVFVALVRETVVMTVRAIEMSGLKIVERNDG